MSRRIELAIIVAMHLVIYPIGICMAWEIGSGEHVDPVFDWTAVGAIIALLIALPIWTQAMWKMRPENYK